MALPTGAGTETLHAHHFADVDGTTPLILGVQHHVYTILSIIIFCNSLNAATDVCILRMVCHDGHAGASGAEPIIARANPASNETWVWNDKFSFNGYEPTGTNVFSASEQIAIAAQSGSTVQKIEAAITHADDDYDITITYLDQDWT